MRKARSFRLEPGAHLAVGLGGRELCPLVVGPVPPCRLARKGDGAGHVAGDQQITIVGVLEPVHDGTETVGAPLFAAGAGPVPGRTAGRAYDVEDADWFFGRERDVTTPANSADATGCCWPCRPAGRAFRAPPRRHRDPSTPGRAAGRTSSSHRSTSNPCRQRVSTSSGTPCPTAATRACAATHKVEV